MTNQTNCRLFFRDRTRSPFGKVGLFAGLLAALMVIVPLQIQAQGSGLNEPTKRLFQAVRDNNMPAVQISITDGANIEAADENGLTPVDIAVDDGFFDIAHFLLSVRNARERPGADTGQAAVRIPETIPVPPAPVAKKLSATTTRPAPPPVPAWPKGKPNPFDPDAAGATLPVLGKVEGEIKGSGVPKVPLSSLSPPKDARKLAEKTSKTLKKVAKVTAPPPPPLPIQKTVETPQPPPSMPLVPPPPSKDRQVTGAPPLGVSERPGDGAQNDVKPSSVERLMDNVSKALKQKAATKTGNETPEVQSLEPDAPRLPTASAPAVDAPAKDVQAEPPPGFIEKASDFVLGLFGDNSTQPPPKTPEGPKSIKDNGGESDAGNAPQQTAITEGNAPTASLSRYLAGITLTLGRSIRLGVPPLAQGGAQSKPCIEKKNGALTFCIEDVDWPNWIEPYFQVNSIMYQGTKTIARYDEGVATSYHIIFPTGSYPAVVQYYTGKFGKPTKTLNRSIAPLAAPRRENPTAIWQSVDTLTKQVSTLEVRKFDDARGTFPDTRRGVVMLYQQLSSPIFPNLSNMELMILNTQARVKG